MAVSCMGQPWPHLTGEPYSPRLPFTEEGEGKRERERKGEKERERRREKGVERQREKKGKGVGVGVGEWKGKEKEKGRKVKENTKRTRKGGFPTFVLNFLSIYICKCLFLW